MRRGDVWWATLQPRSGSEQSGRRPVVVLSHDSFNLTPNWKSVIVIPCSTSAQQAQRTPTVVPLAKGVAGWWRIRIKGEYHNGGYEVSVAF